MKHLYALLAAGLLLSSLGVVTGTAYAQAAAADVQIRDELLKKFRGDKNLAGVNAIVENGTVTLIGTVPSLADREQAEKTAQKVAGVTRVRNLINIMASNPGDDERILREAIKRIRTDPFYSIYDDVNIGVQNGVVTLTGEVWQPARKSDYEKRIASIPGVQAVRNELRVSPTSLMDDRLRHQLTRAIYSHPGLEKYALSPDPPIHIIVDNQRVRLVGVVDSEVDKALVESIVRGFTTLGVTNELRVASKERTAK